MKSLKKYLKADSLALITGASSGIGLAYAELLAENGCNLLLVSNQEQAIFSVADRLAAQYGIHTTALYRDLAQPNAAKELFDYCQKAGLKVHILINNAGVFFFKPITSTEMSRIELVIRLHIETPTELCRLFGHEMEQAKEGYILNMASMAAQLPMPGIALYAASKAYLKSFSRSLFHELGDKGVRVCAVCPGGVATDLYQLPQRYKKLGVRIGVLKTPRNLAYHGLKGMFSGKAVVIPGRINRLFPPLVNAIPSCTIVRLKNYFFRTLCKTVG